MITMLVPQPEIRTPLSTPIAWRDEKRSIVAKGLEPASGAASPIATTQDGCGWLQISALRAEKDTARRAISWPHRSMVAKRSFWHEPLPRWKGRARQPNRRPKPGPAWSSPRSRLLPDNPARAARRGGSARADRTVSRTYWQIDRCRTDFRAAACNHLMPPAEWPMAGCSAAEPWLFPHMPICRDGRPARRFGSSAAIGLRCTDRSGINRQCVAAGRPDRMPQSCPASLCRRHIRSDLVGACS